MDSEKRGRHLVFILLILLSSCSSTKYIQKENSSIEINSGLVLCVFAHQDDDAFIASRLKSHYLNGDSIIVIYTSLSYQEGDKYKNKRIAESKIALKEFDTDSIYYLGFQDGNTQINTIEILNSIQEIVAKYLPKTIYVTAYEGGNIDHDVANFCVSMLNKNTYTEAYEFPLYSAYKSGILPFKLRSYPDSLITDVNKLNKSEYDFTKKYWKYYKSQSMRFGLYLRFVSSLRKTFGYDFIRKLPNYDYKKIPPTNSIAYDKYLKVDFDDFLKAINEVTKANTLHK